MQNAPKCVTMITLNELWTRLMNNVDTHVLPHLRYHSLIVKELKHTLADERNIATNILLYGASGFPVNILWESLFDKALQKQKRQHVWNTQVTYLETPYFFEVDVAYPHNPRDVDVLAAFIKELVQTPSVLTTRHVIVMHNIDTICSIHSGKQSYAFRVLLERFSHNAVFICTTCNRAHIEQPILSRFVGFRVPLATTSELQNIFEHLDIPFHPLIAEHGCRDMFFALYIAWLSMHAPAKITHDLFKYKVADMRALLSKNKKLSYEDIRTLTSNMCVHDASIRDITLDILSDVKCPKKKLEFTICAAQIDHMCATTESFRKPLYVELLLNIAAYGLDDAQYMHAMGLVQSIASIDIK